MEPDRNEKTQVGPPADTAGWRRKALVGLTGLAIIVCYWYIFSGFFPIVPGGLGHDFTLGLPQLLSGYFWFRNNGLSAVFWFSPFICGGVPAFPHPIHFFYSVPQFLSFIVDPFTAVLLNFVVFATAGFWGHYLLVRRLFTVGVFVAVLGATLFLFNGFYVYRYIIGHFLFHSFMLIPWCVLLLSDPALDTGDGRVRKNVAACTGAALIFAYMVHSTLQNLMPPVLLSIAAVGLVYGLVKGDQFRPGAWMLRFGAAATLALGISAAKLSALYHFLSQVPRTGYALPQFTRLSDLLTVLLQSLFFSPAWERAQRTMTNMQFVLKRHEFEYGLTIVPLIILGFGVGALLATLWRPEKRRWIHGRITTKSVVLLSSLLLLLLLPVALNYYTPAWNRFLKTVPIIGSSTQCTRWFCLYIPVITVLTAVVADRVFLFRKFHKTVAVGGVAAVLLLNLTADKDYYRRETYSPLPVMAMYYKVKHGQWEPVITDIGICTDASGRPGLPVFRNDSLVFGQSQMFCYDSAFGYGLENLPFKQLTPGPVLKETDGFLNIKNPACYVFPEANDCRPGDHFTASEKDKVMAFTTYRPYDFKMPFLQRMANRLSLVSLLVSAVLLVWSLSATGIAFWRRKTGSTAENRT